MKKLVFKIICLMLLVMGCVIGLSQLILFIIRTQDIIISSTISYYVSLGAGLIGLILFFILLDCFIFRRIKKLSSAVSKIKDGQYDNKITNSGHDEIGDLITDFNAMSKQLNANQYLSQEFVKNVSHEFKTPLSSIIGYTDLLQTNNQNLTVEQKEYLAIVFNQATRLENMSRKMLFISRLDADLSLIPCSEFSPAKQIQSIIISMQNIWEAKHLEWNLKLNAKMVFNRNELLYSVWQNLISNAIKFANEKSFITIELIINDHITFKIANYGLEIKDDEKLLIFNQFYTNKNRRNEHGSGLGLTLVNKIIQKLNGEISITSSHQLTTFTIIVPNK